MSIDTLKQQQTPQTSYTFLYLFLSKAVKASLRSVFVFKITGAVFYQHEIQGDQLSCITKHT